MHTVDIDGGLAHIENAAADFHPQPKILERQAKLGQTDIGVVDVDAHIAVSQVQIERVDGDNAVHRHVEVAELERCACVVQRLLDESVVDIAGEHAFGGHSKVNRAANAADAKVGRNERLNLGDCHVEFGVHVVARTVQVRCREFDCARTLGCLEM